MSKINLEIQVLNNKLNKLFDRLSKYSDDDLNKIIKKIPAPTAIAILMNIGNGIKFTKITPTKVVTKCPKNTFRG